MSLANQIIYGSVSDVERFLQAGADVNEVDEYGYTPLIETAIVDSLEKAKVVIAHGAEINQPDMVGRTALHWAADNNNIEFCKYLLEQGADPNAYNSSGQCVLVNPLLRGYHNIKNLLYRYGADLKFAQDFISAKLIGHRYELVGQVDIINPRQEFIELDFEGFYLEVTLGIIGHSLRYYKNNFSARHLRSYFNKFQIMIDALAIAHELTRNQYYTEFEKHKKKIRQLLDFPMLVIPIAHEGHALTFIKYKNLLARCDRGEQSKLDGSVVIYEITRPTAFTSDLVMNLIYKKQNRQFVYQGINQLLGLSLRATLPLNPQISGNCSWANVEACMPTMLSILLRDEDKLSFDEAIVTAMKLYHEWLEWDRDRSLYDCIQSFYSANKARKASKAAILGAVLFQRCDYTNSKDMERAEKMIEILKLPDYRYVLQSYVDTYGKSQRNEFGKNLMDILDLFAIRVD